MIQILTYILTQHGTKTQLAKKHGTSMNSVMAALQGMRRSELAMRIRKDAIENFGGVEIK